MSDIMLAPGNENPRSPVKAIRQYCVECAGGSVHEVKLCPIGGCPLYAFRFGKNPYRRVTMSEEQKAANAQRLRNARKIHAEKPSDEREGKDTAADAKAAECTREALK